MFSGPLSVAYLLGLLKEGDRSDSCPCKFKRAGFSGSLLYRYANKSQHIRNNIAAFILQYGFIDLILFCRRHWRPSSSTLGLHIFCQTQTVLELVPWWKQSVWLLLKHSSKSCKSGSVAATRQPNGPGEPMLGRRPLKQLSMVHARHRCCQPA